MRYYFVSNANSVESAPEFVTVIVFTILVLFMSFGVVQLIQLVDDRFPFFDGGINLRGALADLEDLPRLDHLCQRIDLKSDIFTNLTDAEIEETILCDMSHRPIKEAYVYLEMWSQALSRLYATMG